MDAHDFHDCDGTCDRQGRSCEQHDANERIACWLAVIGLALVAAILIYAGINGGGM